MFRWSILWSAKWGECLEIEMIIVKLSKTYTCHIPNWNTITSTKSAGNIPVEFISEKKAIMENNYNIQDIMLPEGWIKIPI